MKAKTPKKKGKTIESMYVGVEPIIIGQPTKVELAKALSWYNYMYDAKTAKQYIVDYVKSNPFYSKEDLQRVRNCSDNYFGITAPSLARILNNGGELCDNHVKFLHSLINTAIISKLNTVEVESDIPTTTIRDRIESKANLVIDEFDQIIDQVLKTRKAVPFSAYDYYRANDISAPVVRIVGVCYTPTLAELDGALGGDKTLSEGYSCFTTKELKVLRDTVKSIIDDCDRYLNNKKVLRAVKPRKVKEKSSVQVVAKLKYKKSDETLKLVSIAPHDIVKADTLWVYNTATRVLGRYQAEIGKSLTVSGTTIKNFDPDLSAGKKLRKPEEALKAMLGCTKPQLKKFLGTLTTTESKLNGRINEDTILLKVLK
jgi:hypothetical protein